MLGGELVAEADGAFFEVVPHREVAQHLEERAMPAGEADAIDVGGAEALLHARHAARGWFGHAEEERFERLHARGREQHRRVTIRHQRRAGDQEVPLLYEVV